MGAASSSPKHVVIEPDGDSFNVITVSDDVVRRFRGIRSTSVTENAGTLSRTDAEERKRIQAAQEKRERELREIEDKNLRDKLNKVEAQLKDRKDEIKLEATLKQSEAFYQEKFDEFMKKQTEIQEESTTKLRESLDSFQKRYMKEDRSKFCVDIESRVQKCYQEKGESPLKCANLAKDFFKCVEYPNAELEKTKQ